MKNRAVTKNHLRALLDGMCIAGAVLAPFFLGIIFVMMILHNSAPVWYLVIHALLFAASLGALIWFISIGLFRAILKKRPCRQNGGDGQ